MNPPTTAPVWSLTGCLEDHEGGIEGRVNIARYEPSRAGKALSGAAVPSRRGPPWRTGLSADRRGPSGRAAPNPDVQAVRWMIEDLRVSLFSQLPGTSGPVPDKRTHAAFDRLTDAR